MNPTDSIPPHIYRDTAGRDWSLAQTVRSFQRVREVLNVDLMQVDQGEPPLATRLYVDPLLLAEVVYQVIGPQLSAASISVEEFLSSCDGNSAARMRSALFAGLTDFFRQWGRTELAEAVRLAIETIERTSDLALDQLRSVDPNTVAREALALMQAGRQRPKTPANAGKRSTAKRDQSASTPAR